MTSPPTTAPSEPPQPGGTLTVLLNAEGRGFDPTIGTTTAAGTDSQRLFPVYDVLLYQDPLSNQIVPQIATSMTTSDGKVWTLKIRPNVKFTDGTPYDAAAVKFNWDRHADPTNNSMYLSTAKSLTTEVVDPLTLKVALSAVNGQFPRIVSIQLNFIASPTAVNAAGSQAAYNTKPVGAGPFILKEWVRDSQMTYVRNPNYWNAPRPYVDTLVIRVIVPEDQRINTFKTGDGSLLFTNTAATAAQLSSYTTNAIPSINRYISLFNMTRPPFNDASARQAVQLAVDRNQLTSVLLQNFVPVPRSYFPENYPFFDPSLTFPDPDLTQAQALVDAYVKRTGSDLNFTWEFSNATMNMQAAPLIQQQVQRLQHVKMNITFVTPTQIGVDQRARNYDVSATTYSGVDPEPAFNDTIVTGGGRNQMGYSSAVVDKAISDSRAALDEASRDQAMKGAEAQLLKDVPFVVLWANPYYWSQQSNIRGFATFDDGSLLTDRVWIKTHA